jgi:hypothetical protein
MGPYDQDQQEGVPEPLSKTERALTAIVSNRGVLPALWLPRAHEVKGRWKIELFPWCATDAGMLQA